MCRLTHRHLPNTSHGVVEYLVVLQQPIAPVVNEHAAVLATPYLVAGDLRVGASADLHPAVEVVEYVVLLQQPVPIVVEVDTDLFPRVDAVLPQDGRGAGGNPDTGNKRLVGGDGH